MGVRAKVRDPRSRTTRTAIGALVVLGVGLALVAVAETVTLVRGRSWMINGPDPALSLDFVPQVVRADSDLWTVVDALDLPLLVRVLCSIPGLVLGLSLAMAAFLVVRVLREIARGQSFSVAARMGLGRLSLVLIIGGVASAVADLAAVIGLQQAINPLREAWVRVLREDAPRVDVAGEPSVPLMVIVLGVIAAAVLFALSDGARLEKDVEGVI